MDYLKVYQNIIDRAIDRKLEGYVEQHHIVPRSEGGSDDVDNLVMLTAKEHFICHLLLLEIYPNSDKLKYAAYAMSNKQANKYQERSYKVSARTYERLKKQVSTIRRNRFEFLCINCNTKSERVVSHRVDNMFCSRACYLSYGGITKGDYHIHKNGVQKFVGKDVVNTYLEDGWVLGRVALQKKVYRYTLEGKLVQEYKSVKDATIGTPFTTSGISQCANGKRKTHKGFYWSYEKNRPEGWNEK